MSQIIPIYIPTFISDQNYNPTRVLPHVYFYNGNIECETFYVADQNDSNRAVTRFPYFDNYSVVTGSFPSLGSKSLLFQNENAVYGSAPTSSLYTEYWEKYIQLLYNPKTRLLNCSAIIPLADYVKMELNDVVNFRGSYYHLRAINEYSLKTGECTLQLLGPIIPDTISDLQPEPEMLPSAVSWSYTESSQNGTFTVYDNATTIATLTSNGSGNALVTQSHYVTASLVPVGYPSSGSVTMSLNVTGGVSLSTTSYSNTTITASFLVSNGLSYQITGSIEWNDNANEVITFTVDNPGVFPYPVTAGNGSASGTITNNSASVYVFAVANSGGNTSGNVGTNSGTVSSTNLTLTGTYSGSGQTIISTNYHTLPDDNTSYNWTLSKQDGLSSGASLRLAYTNTTTPTTADLNYLSP